MYTHHPQPILRQCIHNVRGELGRQAPARWASWSAGLVGRHVKCCRREWKGREGPGTLDTEGGLSLENICRGPEFLVLPMGPVCLISQDRFEQPPCTTYLYDDISICFLDLQNIFYVILCHVLGFTLCELVQRSF